MQDFPANSGKARAEQPREKIERVTSAEPLRRKRGLGRRFKETFIAGDARSTTEHVVEGVIIPAIRDLLFDTFQESIRRYFFGDSHRPRSGTTPWSASNVGHVDYRSKSMPMSRQSPPQRILSRSHRARHNFDELIIPSAQEANEVIDRLYDILSRYGQATVADLYELTGIQSSHTDMKWGWTHLQGAKALRLRQGGFLLDLPEPEAF